MGKTFLARKPLEFGMTTAKSSQTDKARRRLTFELRARTEQSRPKAAMAAARSAAAARTAAVSAASVQLQDTAPDRIRMIKPTRTAGKRRARTDRTALTYLPKRSAPRDTGLDRVRDSVLRSFSPETASKVKRSATKLTSRAMKIQLSSS